jgi:hypothetical protein
MHSYTEVEPKSHKLLMKSLGLFLTLVLATILVISACAPAKESISPGQAYDELASRSKDLHLLEAAMDLGTWDQEVCMPSAGSESRAEMMAHLQQLYHKNLSDSENCWL